jgi:hypothetical protein
MLGPLQPDIAGPLQLWPLLGLGAAHRIHCLGRVACQVVAVPGQVCLGQACPHALRERGTHVGRHVPDLHRVAVMGHEVGGEPLDGGVVATLGGEQHPGLGSTNRLT